MLSLELVWILVFAGGVHCQTIKQLLDSDIPELTTLKSHLMNMKRNIYTRDFASTAGEQFTFFAPSNEAFEKLPKGQKELYNSASLSAADDFELMLKFHTVSALPEPQLSSSGPLRLSYFTTFTQTIGNKAGRITFYLKEGTTYYANGARITRGDIEASNGVIHIVDTIMMYNLAESGSIYEKLMDRLSQSTKIPQPKFTKFMELLKSYEQQAVSGYNAVSCMNNLLSKATVFVPTDEAFLDINTIQLNQLKGNPTQLKKVVDSHIICPGVYFTNMLYDQLSGNGISAYNGVLKPMRFLNDLYISNGCVKAQISKLTANMTLTNGVIQPIDRVLGYLYNTLLEEIAARRDVRDFNRYAQGSQPVRDKMSWEGLPSLEVPESDKYTVFVPQDSEYVTDISQNSDLDNILLSHMLQGEVTLEMLASSSRFETLGKKDEYSNQPAELLVNFEVNADGEKEYYVSVNNVGGKIIKSDICVRNGIIHIVDSLLAVPSQSPMQFLEDDPNLSTFLREVQFMNHFLEDRNKKVTIFAPTDQAFNEMRKSQIGNMLLGFNYRTAFRRILNRHVVVGQEILLSEASLPMDNIQTEFDKISLKKVGDQYKVLFNNNQIEVQIIKPDNRVTNGVVHVIDEVMFVDDLNAREIVGKAFAMRLSPVILFVAVFVSFIMASNM